MALIIHREAQTRLNTLIQKMEELVPRSSHALLSLIMSKALQFGAIEESAVDKGSHDLVLYPMAYSSTDFDWGLWDTKLERLEMHGGICCHTRWFKDVMEGKSLTEAYKESGAQDYLIEWGSHT